MEGIREAIAAKLSQQGILGRVKAELRASVYAVINSETSQTVGSEQREWLLSTEEGVTVAALIAEFLVWAELRHTARVFEAELDFEEHFASRADLAEQLMLEGEQYQPLLLTILQAYMLRQDGPAAPPPQFGTITQEHVQHERASFATVPHLSESHDLHSGGYRYSLALPAAATATAAAQEQPSPLIKAVRPQELAGSWEQALPGESERTEQERHNYIRMNALTASEKDAASEDESSVAASLASPPQRSRPTMISSDLGEVSPTRKSVEELKKQLQSQGLLLSSPLSRPERAKSARSE